jgi:CheY-like chemotaxis protein
MATIEHTDPLRRHILAAAQHLVKVLEAEFSQPEVQHELGELVERETASTPSLMLEHKPSEPDPGTPEAIVRTAPVLLVGEDPDVCVALLMLLEHSGYSVVAAANAGEARALLATGWRPALMVVDVLNGLQRFGANAFTDIPVVLCSGGLAVVPQGATLKVVETLRKPIEIDKLLAVVGRYCDACATAST